MILGLYQWDTKGGQMVVCIALYNKARARPVCQ